jgi:hypothetical protein
MNSWFLSTLNPWLLCLGFAVLIFGIALLNRAWRQPKRHWPMVSLGWIALLMMHWPLGLALGFDRGWATAAILPGFIALLWLGIATPWKEWNSNPKQKTSRAGVAIREPEAILSKQALRLGNHGKTAFRLGINQTGHILAQIIVIGIFSFAAALSLALALFGLLETTIANRTVYSAALVIILWPILMVWSKAAISLLKPATYFVGITLGSLLFTSALF